MKKLNLLPARLNLIELQDCFETLPGKVANSQQDTSHSDNADEYRMTDAIVAILKLLLNPRDEVSFLKYLFFDLFPSCTNGPWLDAW